MWRVVVINIKTKQVSHIPCCSKDEAERTELLFQGEDTRTDIEEVERMSD